MNEKDCATSTCFDHPKKLFATCFPHLHIHVSEIPNTDGPHDFQAGFCYTVVWQPTKDRGVGNNKP